MPVDFVRTPEEMLKHAQPEPLFTSAQVFSILQQAAPALATPDNQAFMEANIDHLPSIYFIINKLHKAQLLYPANFEIIKRKVRYSYVLHSALSSLAERKLLFKYYFNLVTAMPENAMGIVNLVINNATSFYVNTNLRAAAILANAGMLDEDHFNLIKDSIHADGLASALVTLDNNGCKTLENIALLKQYSLNAIRIANLLVLLHKAEILDGATSQRILVPIYSDHGLIFNQGMTYLFEAGILNRDYLALLVANSEAADKLGYGLAYLHKNGLLGGIEDQANLEVLLAVRRFAERAAVALVEYHKNNSLDAAKRESIKNAYIAKPAVLSALHTACFEVMKLKKKLTVSPKPESVLVPAPAPLELELPSDFISMAHGELEELQREPLDSMRPN